MKHIFEVKDEFNCVNIFTADGMDCASGKLLLFNNVPDSDETKTVAFFPKYSSVIVRTIEEELEKTLDKIIGGARK